jgi:DNA-binding GntR family transcriptional regulator
MSEETYLIEAAKQGDTEAFDRLWARHRDKVFRSLLRACGGDPTRRTMCCKTRC